MGTSILASFRALRKDLFELQMTGRGLMLALIAPAVIVLLVGQLNIRPPTLRVLIAGDAEDIKAKSMQDLQRLLRQLPNIRMEVKSPRPIDPLEAAQRGNYDLVIIPDELSSGQLRAYSGDTEPRRVVHLTELASRIETLAVIIKSEQTSAPESNETQPDSGNAAENSSPTPTQEPNAASNSDARAADTNKSEGPAKTVTSEQTDSGNAVENTSPMPTQVPDSASNSDAQAADTNKSEEAAKNDSKDSEAKPPKSADRVQTLSAAGIIPPQSLFLYYPRARDRSAGFLPMTIALVLCFFPFIIAAPSLVREKESHTVEVLLTAPGITHNWLFVAKCYLPILVAAMDAVLMFVCAESFYQYYFKSGLLLLGVYVLLATSAATFLGLAISAVVRSTIQAAAASALYFVCLLLFSGFFVALDQSSGVVRLIASCLPLATLDQIIKAWMFGGQLTGTSALPLCLLLGQTVVFGAIAWASYRCVFLNRI